MVQGVVVENGHLVDVNPATGEVIARVPCSTPEDVATAVKAARAAQPQWAAVPLAERVKLLKAATAALAKDTEELALLITQEMGKVISEAKEEASGAGEKSSFLDLVAEANAPEHIKDAGTGSTASILRQPMGVVAVLSPWNFPAEEILFLALPALAAGNTIVVKPSEVTPLVGAKVVGALQAALPAGVVHLLQGDGAVGSALVASDIDMVAMTGSSATGRKIMEAAAPRLKRLVLELGGKDPMVVFADADLDKAAADAVQYSLFNCGQVCCSVERIYVDAAVKEEFEKKCVALARDWVAGDGTQPDSRLGPMVSAVQKAVVEAHVSEALAQGAQLLYRGEAPSVGNYHPAVVVSNVRPDMRLAVEETFGPVVTILPFDGSEAEAVRLSNASEYGLSASVYSRDPEKATRVAAQVQAGQVGVNAYPLSCAPGRCPWIGAKGSGFGCHSGLDGWRQFSTPKSIITPAC